MTTVLIDKELAPNGAQSAADGGLCQRQPLYCDGRHRFQVFSHAGRPPQPRARVRATHSRGRTALRCACGALNTFCLTPFQRRHKQPGAGGNPASQTLLHYRTGGKLPLPAASGSYDFPARAPGKNRMNPVMKVA